MTQYQENERYEYDINGETVVIDYFVDLLLQASRTLNAPVTLTQVNNLIFLGDINGKETAAGWQSAQELGMEATERDELDAIHHIYERVNRAFKAL